MMEEASPDQWHLCRRYSGILRKLWFRREALSSPKHHDLGMPPTESQKQGPKISENRVGEMAVGLMDPLMPWSSSTPHKDDQNPGNHSLTDNVGVESLSDTLLLGSDMTSLPSVEGYLYGSFFPGVTDLDYQTIFEDGSSI